MVRINLINPRSLADQHLIAEYNEILMLLGYVRKYPGINARGIVEGIPKEYCLGKGHIKFFKDKLRYLKERHEQIKKEMRKRGFAAKKTISLSEFEKELLNNWKPSAKDKKIIKERLIAKIKKKPEYYRYCGKYKQLNFFVHALKRAN